MLGIRGSPFVRLFCSCCWLVVPTSPAANAVFPCNFARQCFGTGLGHVQGIDANSCTHTRTHTHTETERERRREQETGCTKRRQEPERKKGRKKEERKQTTKKHSQEGTAHLHPRNRDRIQYIWTCTHPKRESRDQWVLLQSTTQQNRLE